MTQYHIETAPSPLDLLIEAERLPLVVEVLKIALNENEFRVVCARFLSDEKTYKEIGKEISLSPERTRQIEYKALRRLRRYKYIRILKRISSGGVI